MRRIAEKTLLIGAGKGGVGKSTVALNLSIAMASLGFSVGILDADMYGPSIPIMTGLRNISPKITENNLVIPFTKFGVQIVSLGFFIEEARSVVWRGPMLHAMLEKLIHQVDWPTLDYLFVDLPPGTGDVPLSLKKLLTVEGSLVVSIPQEVAFVDVLKAVNAFNQLNIPTLGLVENMAGHPFGEGKGEIYASRLSVPFLGSIPINPNISRAGDLGVPFAFTEGPDQLFGLLAQQVHQHFARKKLRVFNGN